MYCQNSGSISRSGYKHNFSVDSKLGQLNQKKKKKKENKNNVI